MPPYQQPSHLQAARLCRLFALQCLCWAYTFGDAASDQTIKDVARDWLETARAFERDPLMGPRSILALLH